MAINFPFSPKIDQVYTQGNLSWQWNGIEWVDYISVIDNLNISNALSIGGKITGYNSIKISNGQVLIGNSLSGSFESATLTGGSGIDIANDRGSITITANVAAISGAANSVSNGGGITGFITGGGVLTLDSNGSSANGASTIVTRGADGSFNANVVTASRINVTSTTATSGVTSGALVVAGGVGIAGGVWLGTPNGDEGGQLNLALAAANTTLNGSVVIDIYQNKLRIFENGGSFRGAFIDLTATGASATTNLLSGVTSVSNGGGITGVISGNTLTLGSDETSSNSASTIVTRGADGSFSANIITATLYGAANSATTAGTVTTNAQPNITSVGTLTSLAVTGNIIVGNILTNLANGVSTIGNSTNYFGNIYGTAMLARYADLAESYSADQYYSPGTVVEFGGIKEITLASNETARVAGVISTKPAYLMNMEQQGDNMLAVALQGRVPCQVSGVVHKGDMMVSAGNGYAKACSTPAVGTIIGKALENHFSSSDGVIEVVVGIR
jgi:hypothetical protein